MSDVAAPLATGPDARPSAMTDIWAIRLLALAAAGVAGLLLRAVLERDHAPAGCGPDSDCAAVLHSRWGFVFGVPVSGIGLAAFLLLVQTTQTLSPGRSPEAQRRGWMILAAVSTAAAIAGLWLLALQALALQAICGWCALTTALGLALAGVIQWRTPAAIGGDDRLAGPLTIPRAQPIAVGAGMAAVFIGSQIAAPPKAAEFLPALLRPAWDDQASRQTTSAAFWACMRFSACSTAMQRGCSRTSPEIS